MVVVPFRVPEAVAADSEVYLLLGGVALENLQSVENIPQIKF